MKKWLIDTFLPMWAKETVLVDNRALVRKIRALEQENKLQSAYIKGLERGLRAARRNTIANSPTAAVGENKKSNK